MDPAEQRLFSEKVSEFDSIVAKLIASLSHQHTLLLEKIFVQQQYFKERPWVSHFVPHLDVVREKLNSFLQTDSVSKPAPRSVRNQPITQSIRHSFISLQPTCPEPAPAPNPFLRTCLALGSPRSICQIPRLRERKPSISLGHVTTMPGRSRVIPVSSCPLSSATESPLRSSTKTQLHQPASQPTIPVSCVSLGSPGSSLEKPSSSLQPCPQPLVPSFQSKHQPQQSPQPPVPMLKHPLVPVDLQQSLVLADLQQTLFLSCNGLLWLYFISFLALSTDPHPELPDHQSAIFTSAKPNLQLPASCCALQQYVSPAPCPTCS
eukprot:superscaffoldBa00001368_g10257